MRTGRVARRWILFFFTLAGCTREEPGGEGFFRDVTREAGLDFRLVNGAAGERYLQESMLGGVAFIDYDGDGDQDLFAVNGHSDPLRAREPGREPDHLYRNDGRGRFEDVTSEAGVGDARYGFGAAVGDYDNDGDPDLLVTNFGRNTLYRNGGNGKFADVTAEAGLLEEGFNTSAAWADLDRDGDLDLFIARYLRYRPGVSRGCTDEGRPVYCHPSLFPGEPDLLYENLGNGTFREIGARAGVARGGDYEGKGLGVVAFDYDRDGWIDIFVANDGTPNYLFRNRQALTFTDEAQAAEVALSAEGRALAGMGVDMGDVNGDGLTDLHIINFSHELESLYLNRGEGLFEERARQNGLESTFLTLGFGTLFLDLDLDGDQDMVTANGHFDDLIDSSPRRNGTSYRQRAGLFLNRGDGRFEEASARGGPFFARPVVGRGLARADIDGDGDEDLALMTLEGLVLLRNEARPGGRSLTIRLEGTRSPRDAQGARLLLVVDGRRRVFEYSTARSYLSASDAAVVVGMGASSHERRLEITWPSGKVQVIDDFPARGRVTVREPE